MVSRILPVLSRGRQFTSPYAPRFLFLGAQVTGRYVKHLKYPLFVMGKGANPSIAQLRMCGEAVERVSINVEGANNVWRGHTLLRGETIEILPSVFFAAPYFIRSHGCACHNHVDAASTSAIAELWERRAVQDWWQGSCCLRILSQSHPQFEELSSYVSSARQGAVEMRETLFFLISGHRPVDVALALSRDRDGKQAALAFAAGTGSLSALFRRAFEELLSVELETADLHRARLDGDVVVPGSNRHLVQERQRVLHKRFSTELQGVVPFEFDQVTATRQSSTEELLRASEDAGAPIWLIDMTHKEIGVPTIRAVFERPDLNPFVYYDDDEILPL